MSIDRPGLEIWPGPGPGPLIFFWPGPGLLNFFGRGRGQEFFLAGAGVSKFWPGPGFRPGLTEKNFFFVKLMFLGKNK